MSDGSTNRKDFVEAASAMVTKQKELVAKLLETKGNEVNQEIVHAYEANSKQLRETMEQNKQLVLEGELLACNDTILALINDTKSAIDSINILQQQ